MSQVHISNQLFNHCNSFFGNSEFELGLLNGIQTGLDSFILSIRSHDQDTSFLPYPINTIGIFISSKYDINQFPKKIQDLQKANSNLIVLQINETEPKCFLISDPTVEIKINIMSALELDKFWKLKTQMNKFTSQISFNYHDSSPCNTLNQMIKQLQSNPIPLCFEVTKYQNNSESGLKQLVFANCNQTIQDLFITKVDEEEDEEEEIQKTKEKKNKKGKKGGKKGGKKQGNKRKNQKANDVPDLNFGATEENNETIEQCYNIDILTSISNLYENQEIRLNNSNIVNDDKREVNIYIVCYGREDQIISEILSPFCDQLQNILQLLKNQMKKNKHVKGNSYLFKPSLFSHPICCPFSSNNEIFEIEGKFHEFDFVVYK